MISANLGLILWVGLVASGSDHHPNPRPGACDDCGVASAVVLREIQVLRTSPKKGAREDAAEDLRRLDWRCHPEVVLALADALLLDRSGDVREEAAESLGKMGACVPQAHEALIRAASGDPDGGVRKEARKALGSIRRRCIADCRACGPIPTSTVIHGPTIIPPDWMPFLEPRPAGRPSTRPAPSPAPAPDPGLQLDPLPPPPSPDVPPPPPTPYTPDRP